MMSRKTTQAGRKASAATGRTPSSKTRPKSTKETQTAAAKGKAKPAKTSPRSKTPTAAGTATAKVAASLEKKGPAAKRKPATAKAGARPAAAKAASAEVLAKAEALPLAKSALDLASVARRCSIRYWPGPMSRDTTCSPATSSIR